MDLVTPNIGLLFWMSVVFLILLFLLRKFAWKPILNAVQTRENAIKDALISAENARKEIQNLKADNEKILAEARKERDTLLTEARDIKNQIIFQAKQEAVDQGKKLIEQAKAAIEIEKQNAVKVLKNHVAELSLGVAEKLITTELSSKDAHLKQVEAMLKDVNFN